MSLSEAKTQEGMAALHICVTSFYDHMADTVPGDYDFEDNLDNTDTMIGAGIDALANAGADCSVQDASGKTAMELAAEIGLFPTHLIDRLR